MWQVCQFFSLLQKGLVFKTGLSSCEHSSKDELPIRCLCIPESLPISGSDQFITVPQGSSFWTGFGAHQGAPSKRARNPWGIPYSLLPLFDGCISLFTTPKRSSFQNWPQFLWALIKRWVAHWVHKHPSHCHFTGSDQFIAVPQGSSFWTGVGAPWGAPVIRYKIREGISYFRWGF